MLKDKEVEQLKEQSMMNIAKSSDDYNVMKDELVISQQRLQELEREKNDLESRYDKDIALWEGKCSFLEEIKAQLKKELAENTQKFENAIDQLQQKPKDDGKQVKYQEIQKQVEEKYIQQIKDLN